MSGMQRGRSVGAMWYRPNSWKPGESIRAVVRAASIQYQVVVVVVCLPVLSTREISLVAACAPGTSRLISVLLPTPEGPSTKVRLPASRSIKASFCSGSSLVRFSGMTG